jgi:endonuclease-3
MSKGKIRGLKRIISLLEEAYGTDPWNWHTRQTPFQVLIGTVLSQRTKDCNTDRAAMALFSRFPTPERLARADIRDIESLIRPSNYYRTKARKIREISRIISEEHRGKAPDNIDDLIKLPGVGRKTASCTLLYGHRISRIPVDVHVMVISQRLGWTSSKDPDEIQKELEESLPRKEWPKINELMVKHGQEVCHTRNPKCWLCKIEGYCSYPEKRLRR